MLKGRVIKSYNSFFYVQVNSDIISCKLRGRLKKGKAAFAIVSGDIVNLEILPDKTGIIENHLPRVSLLKRPAVANVTQVILTFAAAEPDLHPLLLNKFLVLAEWSAIPNICICINKIDLYKGRADEFLSPYEKLGYKIFRVSAKENIGIDELKKSLANNITVFAGPSGVGKSSLLNAINPDLLLSTGKISDKIKRGRHTTRVAELLSYDKTNTDFIVDTPGFSAMDLGSISLADLPSYFPEFRAHLDMCRFTPCSHTHEPSCAIKNAVENGAISLERYMAYTKIYEEIKALQQSLRKKEFK